MASVQKRVRASGTTTYLVRWYAPDGAERTKGGFRTRKTAQAYATKVENGKLRGVEFDPNKGKVLFREAAQAWLASRDDLKPTTLAAYHDALAPTPATGLARTRHKALADLRIDTVFGGYPLNEIAREDIQAWVTRMKQSKKPSTVRNAYFLVRMVLGQAVVDGRLAANPADYVKLPTEHNTNAQPAPAQFLTAAEVSALVAATPWPYNIYVHVAAWAGLRAAELCGLTVGDVDLPNLAAALAPYAPANKPGVLRVERSVARLNGQLAYVTPKTKGSRRAVPLTADTTELLRGYLAVHPRRADPSAPLFPGLAQPTPDWSAPLRHATFYKAIYRPAVLRAGGLPPNLRFHALRHTYASLCVAAGIPPLEIARFMGHAKVTTTLGTYAHLFEDDHAGAMAALGAMNGGPRYGGNVIRLHG
jgi:integrase